MVKKRGFVLVVIVCMMAACFHLLLTGPGARADTFVWQDFEYWNAPSTYGWKSSCPPYPVYGWCPYTGFGRISTVIDPGLQSRVLLYECMMSHLNQFYPFFAWNESVTYPNGDPISDKSIISFNIRMWFGIEWFDQWEVQVFLVSRKGEQVNLIYRPVGQGESGPIPYEGRPGDIFSGRMDPPGYVYELGRQYQDGTWHLVLRDLDRDVAMALGYEMDDTDRDGFGKSIFGPGESRILSIMLKGYQLMVDNIAFHDTLGDIINHPPKLQRIGPQYAQLFVPFSTLITATDIELTGASDESRLEFLATIGGYGSQGIQTTDLIHRVKEDPNNAGSYILCANSDPACAKDKVMLQFVPQHFEDLIVTIRVVDEGGLSDIETFPLSVVNYPVENHPPYFEEIEDDVYILGSNEGYFVKQFVCYDKDEEDIPGTIEEPGNITYSALINGLPSYQYGPWQEPIIPVPCVPEISFSPQFEGIYRIQVIATDPRGLSAVTEFTLVVVNYGTWLNHPPILCEDIDSPQIAKAGRTFLIPVEFFDPDGDVIHYSCNIGSVTEMKPGFGITPESEIGQTVDEDKKGRYVSGAVYTLTTPWPGRYLVEIIAYDIRGGYAVMTFLLDVEPWWTF
ncbi:MAG: hypothetical protein ACMUIL_00315 [bacterium]